MVLTAIFICLLKHKDLLSNSYQTSVFEVKTPSRKASGDIHFIGTKATPFFL